MTATKVPSQVAVTLPSHCTSQWMVARSSEICSTRAKGGPFVRLQSLQLPIQHRSQDFTHELAAGDPAGHGDAGNLLSGIFMFSNAVGDEIG